MPGREKYMYKKNKLTTAFYAQEDVVQIATALIGKVLVTNFDGDITAARIVETEAYNGIVDKASHAYNNRRTRRTEVMFGHGGVAYVYLCYGIHYLFNVVTNTALTPHAVLIRAVEPLYGVETMLQRTGKVKAGYDLTRGPGNVSKALGIAAHHTGMSLLSDELFIADDGFMYPASDIISRARIGVDYAAEDALLPYRFLVRNNPFVSGKRALNNVQ
jgi:DNA-3-methyladenine glycosylase